VPYRTISVRRTRHIIPDEAHGIASELRDIASEARDLAARLRALSGGLEATWEGRAKTRFLVDFNGEPPVGESNASWLEAESQRVSSITVEVSEMVLTQIWVPGPEDQGEMEW
jgi:uncharacterized protein YukE